MFRGGFRFTPVDMLQSVKSKRVVYDITQTYGKRLPGFNRIDFGASYRINNKKGSWMIMADIQNLFNRENVEYRRFEFRSGQVVENDYHTLGRIPVLSVKVEF
jgi:outer membrane receptor protein involved in Fe transport